MATVYPGVYAPIEVQIKFKGGTLIIEYWHIKISNNIVTDPVYEQCLFNIISPRGKHPHALARKVRV